MSNLVFFTALSKKSDQASSCFFIQEAIDSDEKTNVDSNSSVENVGLLISRVYGAMSHRVIH
jgi:hypothetical protein